MRKPERKWRKAVATGFLQAMTLIVLISAPVCRSQDEATACFPENGNPPTDGGGCGINLFGPWPSMCGGIMAPNTTSTMYIRGSIPTSGGCPDIFLFAAEGGNPFNEWVLYSTPDPDVSITNFKYLSPTLSSFTISIGGAPSDHVQIQLYTMRYLVYTYDFWIEPPAPPPPPAPSQSNPNCPTITIASVTPSVWIAGIDNPIVITGSGFASQPAGDCIATQVSASVPISNIKIVGDNTITAVVTPPAMGAGPQPADRRVASRAIAADTALAAGNTTVTAYLMLFGTEPAEGSNMAWTTAQLLRAPQIWFQNASTSQPNRVISTSDGSTPPTQSTVVGQQIKLTTRPASLPNGLTISKNVWTLTGTTIDGYKASTGGSSVQPTTSTEMAQTPLTIYWPYPSQGSTFQVTYQYCVDLTSGRKCSETATAQFDVSGGGMMSAAPWKPTPPLIDLTIDQLIQCVQQNGILVRPTTNITFAPSVVYGNVTGDNCGFVNMGSTYGITFTPSGSPPKGTYTYVQLLDFDDRKSVNRVKGSTSGCITEFVPGVDKIYPYKGIILGTKPPQAEDAPADSLGNGEVESGSFIATMFLMWTSKTKNSIPVPIGYQTWGFSGGAHQDASGTWIPTVSGWPPPGTIGGFVPDWGGNSWDGYTALQNGYPIWSGPGGCS